MADFKTPQLPSDLDPATIPDGAVPAYDTGLEVWAPDDTVVRSDDSRLSDARTPTQHTHTKDQVTGLPAATTGASNNAFGRDTQQFLTSGSNNNAFGYAAQQNVTSGSHNSAFGHTAQQSLTTGVSNNASGHSAQKNLTSGSYNSVLGQSAQENLTIGTNNCAFGHAAQRDLTSGSNNVGFGRHVQFAPRGIIAWGTTTGNRQTCLGHESGQGSSDQVDEITTLGYRAIAAAIKGTALGSLSSAAHERSVALGSDTITTAADQVMVGPRDVEITNATRGVILRSPNGARWRLTVANDGTLTTTGA